MVDVEPAVASPPSGELRSGRDVARGLGRSLLTRSNQTFGLCALCRPCTLGLVERLDGSILRWLRQNVRGLPEQAPPELLQEVRRLRLPMVMLVALVAGALGLQAWSATDGWRVLAQTGNSVDCDALRRWLLCFTIVGSMLLMFCFGVGPPLMLLWAFYGQLLRSQVPKTCRRSQPVLWAFPDKLLMQGGISCGMLVLSGLFVLLVKRRLNRMQQVWGSNGPAAERVVRSILAAARPEAPEGTECAICLDDGGQDWRALLCGHAFHEHCLLRWLRQARRCPLCRMDLHAAYLPERANVSRSIGPEADVEAITDAGTELRTS